MGQSVRDGNESERALLGMIIFNMYVHKAEGVLMLDSLFLFMSGEGEGEEEGGGVAQTFIISSCHGGGLSPPPNAGQGPHERGGFNYEPWLR